MSGPGPAVSLDELLATDHLAKVHAQLVAGGTPGPAAATYLAGWYGGSIAQEVGLRLAVDGTALVVDRSFLRFELHPDGWPERIDVGPCPALRVGAHSGHEIRWAVEALVAVGAPLISACRRLARIGRVGLWNEVGDRLAMAAAYQARTPVTPAMLEVLETAWSTPGAPWRARPRLGFARSEILGEVHVAQKGGCCLSYTTPTDGEPHYCAHCPFRSTAGCDAAQVTWLEQEHARLAKGRPAVA